MNFSVIKGLAAVIRANGGSIDSRIRLQKQAYLLKWLGYPNFASLRFSYHHFGPYSRDLSEDIQHAVLDRLITEKYESFENDHTRYSYHITDKGDKICTDVLGEVYSESMARMRELHWRVLELGATALFLERDERLDPESAFQRALSLKPECTSYSHQARELIAMLQTYRGSRPAAS